MTKHNPILKTHWERYKSHFNIDEKLAAKLIKPYCSNTIKKLTLLSEGCANTNYKVEFENEQPIVIRIYMREKESLSREIALHHLLNEKIPIPKFIYHDNSCTLIGPVDISL